MVWPVHNHLDQMGKSRQRREGMKSAGGAGEAEEGYSHEAACSAKVARQQWEERACWSLSNLRMGPGLKRRIVDLEVGTRGSGKGMPWGCSLRIRELLHPAGSAALVGMGLPGCPCIARRVRGNGREARQWVDSGATSWGRVLFRRLGSALVEGVI
jgi:hypothetical protein